MAKKREKDDVITHKNNIQLELKKEEVTYYYDKYCDPKITFTAMQVAREEGVVKGNTVFDRKKMMKLEWIMQIVELAKDKMNATNNLGDISILDYYYDKVVRDVSLNWASCTRTNKRR